MEIIRGNLDDISRPASSEQTGRVCATSPFALVVLSNGATAETQSNSVDTDASSASGSDQCQCNVNAADETEDCDLERAIEEIRRLDEILSEMICKEKEAKRQRKELQARLWQELQHNTPSGYSESAHEASNTRLFLALEACRGEEEEEETDFVGVFETQVPDSDQDMLSQPLEQSEKRPVSSESGEEQFENSHRGASRGKKKQDFVKRNIELASADVGQVPLTPSEKQRLAELLRQMDEEEGDSARGADSEEDMWAMSVLAGQGYTPAPSDLEQLIDIDSKMRLLLPDEEFASLQSSYTNLSATQGHGSEVGWKCTGNPQPGEKVLQDIKERRKQERRLREIQQQLEILGRSPEMTNESPDLTEEQLLSLLDECELTEIWSQDNEATDSTQADL